MKGFRCHGEVFENRLQTDLFAAPFFALVEQRLRTQKGKDVRVIRNGPRSLRGPNQVRNFGFRFLSGSHNGNRRIIHVLVLFLQTLHVGRCWLGTFFSFGHNDLRIRIVNDELNGFHQSFFILLLLIFFTMNRSFFPFAVFQRSLGPIKNKKDFFNLVLRFETMDHLVKPFFKGPCCLIDLAEFMRKERHVDRDRGSSHRQRLFPRNKASRTVFAQKLDEVGDTHLIN